MKSYILLLALAALAFSSCTSAYKTGQTPDDVYYSPVREKEEYVVVDKKDDRAYSGTEEYYEDRYLHYRVNSPYRWSTLDDYYFYSPYAWQYGGYTSWSSPYSSYHCWNSYYNPYYPGVIVINKPGFNFYTRPSKPIAFNPRSYNSSSSNSRSVFSSSRYNGNNNNNSRYNNSNRNSFGNSVKRVFSSDSRPDYSNGSSTPSRSYNPSSNSSSSSSSSGGRSSSSGSSSGGGGGSVSRPGR